MALFRKDDDHAGSGIDKPQKRGLVDRLIDTVKASPAPAAQPLATPAPVPDHPVVPTPKN